MSQIIYGAGDCDKHNTKPNSNSLSFHTDMYQDFINTFIKIYLFNNNVLSSLKYHLNLALQFFKREAVGDALKDYIGYSELTSICI